MDEYIHVETQMFKLVKNKRRRFKVWINHIFEDCVKSSNIVEDGGAMVVALKITDLRES